MTETRLTRDRFAELADAYGGDLRRWPEPTRAPARRLAASDPAAAAILTESARLDALFDEVRAPGPGAALTQAVIASAPRARRLRFGGWRIVLGLAGAALAGTVSGAAAIAIAPPPPIEHAAPAPAEATALFDDPQADDS